MAKDEKIREAQRDANKLGRPFAVMNAGTADRPFYVVRPWNPRYTNSGDLVQRCDPENPHNAEIIKFNRQRRPYGDRT